MKLHEMLQVVPGITSVVGSGGKTALLDALAHELPGTVILATSTHILPFAGMPLLTHPSERDVRDALKRSRCACVGTPTESGRLTAPCLDFGTLARCATYVLVEADGSHRLPLKAHADWEPVCPPDTGRTVLVVGTSGLGRPLDEVVHRHELLCGRLTVPQDAIATPALVAQGIAWELEHGIMRPDVLLLNQCDTPRDHALASQLARELTALLKDRSMPVCTTCLPARGARRDRGRQTPPIS